MPILNTRFYKPEISGDFIRRKALLAKLDKGKSKPLTLITAGGGFGKSILASQWLETVHTKYCWISIEKDCNNLRVFSSYVLEAINRQFPDSMQESRAILRSGELPLTEVISNTLINEIISLEEDFILVFDDYHVIKNTAVHEFVDFLIQNTPGNLKIIIITRYDPPLNLNKLNAYGKILEIRVKDLRFTEDEILNLAAKYPTIKGLSQDAIAKVLATTEGWIIGIQFIMNNLSLGKELDETLRLTSGKTNHISEYFFNDFFSSLPENLQECMLKASLFNRFSSELLLTLCPKLEDEKIEADVIGNFMGSAAFIISLDNEKKWYRFHHLVQEYLSRLFKSKYPETIINETFELGSRFFESKGLFEEAIQYAVKSGNMELVVEIIDRNKHELYNTDQLERLKRWLEMIPKGIVEKQASLLLIRVLLNEPNSDYKERTQDLENARLLLTVLENNSERLKHLWGEYYCLQAAVAVYTGKANLALEASEKAMELLPLELAYMHNYAIAHWVFAKIAKGESSEALEMLHQHKILLPEFNRINLMYNQIITFICYAIQGHLSECKSPAALARDISREESHWLNFTMAGYFLAAAAYMQNNLEEARDHIQKTLESKLTGRPYWILNVKYFEACYLLATDQLIALENCLNETISFAEKFGFKGYRTFAKCIDIELKLRQGRVNEAKALQKEADFNPYSPLYFLFFPQLTEVKLLMADGDGQNLEEAEVLLNSYMERALSSHNVNFSIQVYCISALLQAKKNNYYEALSHLRISLSHTREGGYIRLFTDCGKEMERLFNLLTPEEKKDPIIQYIIRSFNENRLPAANAGNKLPSVEIEFNSKELEILRMVSEGYQNKEIADKLFFSLGTVKNYIYKICQKLDVNNRTSAIALARSLGLIDYPGSDKVKKGEKKNT